MFLPSGVFACLSGWAQFLVPGLYEVIQYIYHLSKNTSPASPVTLMFLLLPRWPWRPPRASDELPGCGPAVWHLLRRLFFAASLPSNFILEFISCIRVPDLGIHSSLGALLPAPAPQSLASALSTPRRPHESDSGGGSRRKSIATHPPPAAPPPAAARPHRLPRSAHVPGLQR